MKKRPKRLSSRFVKYVAKPGRYGDGRGGHGLSLRVSERKGGGWSKTWAQRLRIDGRPTNLGLGSYPVVTLAMARARALENRRALAQGENLRKVSRRSPTFAQAAEKVITFNTPNWKTGEQEARIWRSTFRLHLPKSFQQKRIDQLAPADVLAVLTPLWNTKPETARRVRQRVAAVLKWAVAHGYRTDNPAGEAISYALPRQRSVRQHFRALPYDEVAGAIAKVRQSGAGLTTKLCLEFLVLTAARPGEARHARWSDIDFDAATWTIPAERMKAGRPHRVPLSDRAMSILNDAAELHDGTGRIFPSPTGKVLSDMTLSKLLRDLGLDCVPHGFRSGFRDWASEKTDAPNAVMELALAHKVGSAVEQAYARSDLFERRRALMQDWADFLRATA